MHWLAHGKLHAPEVIVLQAPTLEWVSASSHSSSPEKTRSVPWSSAIVFRFSKPEIIHTRQSHAKISKVMLLLDVQFQSFCMQAECSVVAKISIWAIQSSAKLLTALHSHFWRCVKALIESISHNPESWDIIPVCLKYLCYNLRSQTQQYFYLIIAHCRSMPTSPPSSDVGSDVGSSRSAASAPTTQKVRKLYLKFYPWNWMQALLDQNRLMMHALLCCCIFRLACFLQLKTQLLPLWTASPILKMKICRTYRMLPYCSLTAHAGVCLWFLQGISRQSSGNCKGDDSQGFTKFRWAPTTVAILLTFVAILLALTSLECLVSTILTICLFIQLQISALWMLVLSSSITTSPSMDPSLDCLHCAKLPVHAVISNHLRNCIIRNLQYLNL